MGIKDARVDAYIAHAAEFARPILTHLRGVVHAGCPAVTETIKWGHPYFEYKGVLCSMAAFSAHCAFGFWHAQMRAATDGAKASEAMGQFGRITRLADLPNESSLKALVREAASLNETAAKPIRTPATAAPRN
jgi:hypothetical protein